MTKAKPQTIYKKLNDEIAALSLSAETFFDTKDLYIRRLYADAEKLKQANFEQGMASLAILDFECGKLDEGVKKLQQVIDKGGEYYWPASLLLTASTRFLRPSIVAKHLDNLTQSPHSFFNVHTPSRVLAIGAYEHAFKAAATLNRSKLPVQNGASVEASVEVATHMQQSGVSQKTSTAIIECAGHVLARHNIRHDGNFPEHTTHHDETGVWVRIPVTPEYAAQLDAELIEELISKGLDTEPFFVSFMGTKQA